MASSNSTEPTISRVALYARVSTLNNLGCFQDVSIQDLMATAIRNVSLSPSSVILQYRLGERLRLSPVLLFLLAMEGRGTHAPAFICAIRQPVPDHGRDTTPDCK